MIANDRLFCWCVGILAACMFVGCIAAGLGHPIVAVVCSLIGFAATALYAYKSLR